MCVECVVLAGNADGRFRLDRSSGQVSCDPLDREIKSSYALTIEATDAGQPPLKSTMLLHIQVGMCEVIEWCVSLYMYLLCSRLSLHIAYVQCR